MVGGAMTITLVCPICDKPLTLVNVNVYANSDRRTYEIGCPSEDHKYSATATTEAEARAILAKPQKVLADALSARIALPIEQRRHAKARQQVSSAATIIADAFSQSVLVGLQETPPRQWLCSWEQQALDWLREWRKAGADTPINWWTSSYMNYGPPPWGDKK